ncbi:MAG TPA: hypothetical protein VLA93_05060 [Pyrinomonadaceae bacterium]|nr:hypothetical protein [Pyrinomonadaceae bacterium]
MKRPLSVTILGWVFVVVGSVGLAAGLIQLSRVTSTGGISSLNRPYLTETGLVVLSGLIAAIGGAGLLHGFRWARWVCITWMALHVVLSMWHSMIEVVFHLVMLIGMIYILFRKRQPQMIDG